MTLHAENLSIAYRQKAALTQILRDVTMELVPGRIVGLAGESGSGKSTLALAMLGYRPAGQETLSGQVELEGQNLTRASVRELRQVWGSRLAYLPQDTATSLNPALTIRRHFVETLRRHEDISWRAAETKAAQWLSKVDIPDPAGALGKYPHQFSGGQQQRIALAMALSTGPQALILDEPTTGLDVVTQAHVNRLIVALARDAGIATLYVSHNLALLATVCDELAIMYAGQIVERGPAAQVYHHPRHPYTAALIAAVPTIEADHLPRGIPGIPRSSVPVNTCGFAERCRYRTDACATDIPLVDVDDVTGERQARCIVLPAMAAATSAATVSVAAPAVEAQAAAILTVDGLRCQFGEFTAVDGVSLQVLAGKALGIAGQSGSGKSTVLRAIAGLLKPVGGTISFRGTPLAARSAERPTKMRGEIQIVFQNPDATLNPRHTIYQSMERPLRLFRPDIARGQRREAVAEMMRHVRLSPDLIDRYPRNLSGGQRQRVAIGRALLADPVVLLCDEITSALDVSVQASILELLIGLRAERDLALVFVTHDLGVLRSIADEAVILRRGVVCEQGPTTRVLREPRDAYTAELLRAVPDPTHAAQFLEA